MKVMRLVLTAILSLAVSAAAAFAQGSFFTSLSGTVVDSSGAVIPGADVKVKNNGTGEEVNTISGARRRLHRAVVARRHLLGDRLADGLQDGRPRIGHRERRGSRAGQGHAVGRRASRRTSRSSAIGHGRAVAVAGDLDQPHRRSRSPACR